jgi:hypothetical protein
MRVPIHVSDFVGVKSHPTPHLNRVETSNFRLLFIWSFISMGGASWQQKFRMVNPQMWTVGATNFEKQADQDKKVCVVRLYVCSLL